MHGCVPANAVAFLAMTVSAKEFCRQTGLTYRQVDYWVRRGVLATAVRRAPGSGYERPFDEDEVRVATVLGSLRTIGAPVDVLSEVAEQLRALDENAWHGVVYVDSAGLVDRQPHRPCWWAIDLEGVLA